MQKEKILKNFDKYTNKQLKLYSAICVIFGIILFVFGIMLYFLNPLYSIFGIGGFLLIVCSIYYQWIIKLRTDFPQPSFDTNTSLDDTTEKQIPSIHATDNNSILTLKGFNGQIYVYENRIEIKRKSFNSLLYHGLAGDKTIPMASIKTVQLKKGGLFKGFIQFGVVGGSEKQFGKKDALHDENSVVIMARHNTMAVRIKNYVENAILSPQKIEIVNNSISTPDEIAKYKKLLDDGAITDDEFQAKKRQLLDG